MALTTTPLGSSEFPDVSARETVTTSTATTDIFDGAIALHSLVLDNSQNSGHNTYFKFYNAGSVTPANDLPNLVIRVEQAVSTTVIIADGLSFSTAVSIRAIQGAADDNTTVPSANTQTILVGS